MRIRLLWLVSMAVVLPMVQAQPLRTGVDRRIELMSILFRLSGAQEYSQGAVPSYIQAIDRHFEPYRDHEAVRMARELRRTQGVSYDAVMSMAVNIKDAESLAERVPFDSRDSRLERRWQGVKARPFLEAARRFVRDSKFAEFANSQQALYQATDTRLAEYVTANVDIPWFDRFYGARAKARFIVVPGLVNGGGSYGATLTAEDGVEEIYAIPGVWQVDTQGLPTFSASWVDTLVHEFAHSYCNPLIDSVLPQLAKAGPMIIAPVPDLMARQAYPQWETVLRESLVRASTVRYIWSHKGEQEGQRAANYERGRGFVWTADLAALLGEYEHEREKYPAMQDFLPRVVEFFSQLAPKAAGMVAQYDESRPRVLSLSIENGAQDVDPAITEIVARFSRPMLRNRYAVMKVAGTEFPKVNSVRFDDTGTVLTIAVSLEPGKQYGLSLNSPAGGSFQSEEGVLALPRELRFRTRAAQPPQTASH